MESLWLYWDQFLCQYAIISDICKQLLLLVVSADGPSLLGRYCLMQLHLDWTAIHQLCSPDELQAVLDHHSEVFKEEELGILQGKKVKLHIDTAVQPKFVKH